MVHNEDNDPIDDDDQYVYRWQRKEGPLDCLLYFGSCGLITSSQYNVWEIVSQCHHEVC
jgi:hypothetical protein